ncbi:MAG: putative lipid II flippase FtsW [Nitrospirae bacterium]|nr:putative lipid II flippase FtsW [Nitrospirota bacterium]
MNNLNQPERVPMDRWLMIAVCCLILTGFCMVYSSTAIIMPLKQSGNSENLIQLHDLEKQGLSLIIGFICMMTAIKIDLRTLKNNAVFILFAVFVLLILVLIPHVGSSTKGAQRWIRHGFISLQPSEFSKLAMVIFLARYLSSAYFRTDKAGSFMLPIFVMLMTQGLLMMQPDFGTSAIIGVLTITLLYASGARLRYILSLLVVIVPVAIKLIMEPYRLGRIIAYLNPWADPSKSGFQLIQSLYAIGIGGFDGVGIGKSTQKLAYLPESRTDFIFSIIAEETGLIGSLMVLGLFIFFFIRGLMIIKRSTDKFSFFLAIGITYMIVAQAIINISVVSGLLPTKGLALPFISYGGSSLIVNMIAVGILLNISGNGSHTSFEETQTTDNSAKKGKNGIWAYGLERLTFISSKTLSTIEMTDIGIKNDPLERFRSLKKNFNSRRTYR